MRRLSLARASYKPEKTIQNRWDTIFMCDEIRIGWRFYFRCCPQLRMGKVDETLRCCWSDRGGRCWVFIRRYPANPMVSLGAELQPSAELRQSWKPARPRQNTRSPSTTPAITHRPAKLSNRRETHPNESRRPSPALNLNNVFVRQSAVWYVVVPELRLPCPKYPWLTAANSLQVSLQLFRLEAQHITCSQSGRPRLPGRICR